MRKITERIKEIRTSKGLSHEYMAEMLHISQPAYCKIENNKSKLSLERFFKIIEILNLNVQDVLYPNCKILPIDVYEKVIQNTEPESNSKDKALYEIIIQKQQEEITFLRNLLATKI
jgi:transcriptional regulator with XRE-family HTH domain